MLEMDKSKVSQRLPAGPSTNVTVYFTVKYDTQWGEVLVLSGSRGLLGAGSIEKGLKMQCSSGPEGLIWKTNVVVPSKYECEYTFTVYNEHSERVVRKECARHQLKVPSSAAGSTILLSDCFQSLNSIETIYKSSAFKDVIFGNTAVPVPKPLPNPSCNQANWVTVRFRITDSTLLPGKKIYVTGTAKELGRSQEFKALPLTIVGTGIWSGDLSISAESFPFTYRYCLNRGILYRYFIADDQVDLAPECLVEHENGGERTASITHAQSNTNGKSEAGVKKNGTGHNGVSTKVSVVYLNDGHFRHRRPWRGAGLAIPVFSMRTEDSIGCGEFLDIKKMVDFVASCGMHVLQLQNLREVFWVVSSSVDRGRYATQAPSITACQIYCPGFSVTIAIANPGFCSCGRGG